MTRNAGNSMTAQISNSICRATNTARTSRMASIETRTAKRSLRRHGDGASSTASAPTTNGVRKTNAAFIVPSSVGAPSSPPRAKKPKTSRETRPYTRPHRSDAARRSQVVNVVAFIIHLRSELFNHCVPAELIARSRQASGSIIAGKAPDSPCLTQPSLSLQSPGAVSL